MDVRLRRYGVDDAAVVAEAVQESLAELMPWMPWCHPGYSVEEAREWLALQVAAFDAGRAYEFAIVSGDGRYLGGCGLNGIDRLNRRANLGYWVRSSATRQGVAGAAVRAIHEWAFGATDLIRLEILVAVENVASLRVAEKSGAVRDGTLAHRLLLQGGSHDAAMFALTRPAVPLGPDP